MRPVDLNAELGLFLIQILDGRLKVVGCENCLEKATAWVRCAEGGNSLLGLWSLRVSFNFAWIQVSELLSAAAVFFSLLSLVKMLDPVLIFSVSYDSWLTLFSGNRWLPAGYL